MCLWGSAASASSVGVSLSVRAPKAATRDEVMFVLAPEHIPAATEAEHAGVEGGLGGLGQAADASDLEARLTAGAVQRLHGTGADLVATRAPVLVVDAVGVVVERGDDLGVLVLHRSTRLRVDRRAGQQEMCDVLGCAVGPLTTHQAAHRHHVARDGRVLSIRGAVREERQRLLRMAEGVVAAKSALPLEQQLRRTTVLEQGQHRSLGGRVGDRRRGSASVSVREPRERHWTKRRAERRMVVSVEPQRDLLGVEPALFDVSRRCPRTHAAQPRAHQRASELQGGLPHVLFELARRSAVAGHVEHQHKGLLDGGSGLLLDRLNFGSVQNRLVAPSEAWRLGGDTNATSYQLPLVASIPSDGLRDRVMNHAPWPITELGA